MSMCTLCELPTPDPPVRDPAVGGEFCCRGCLEVQRRLHEVEGEGDRPADPRSVLDTADKPSTAESEIAYLSVEGMHCATCESFIESRAIRREGVVAAEASYPSGTVKLSYDPDRIDADSLSEVIDGLGYSARGIEEASNDRVESVGRLVIGGFFAMMTMLWYVLFLYPAYLGVNPARLLIDVGSPAGTYLIANIWVMSTVVIGYTGFPLLRGAYVSLRAGQPNMDLLVGVAVVTAYVYSSGIVITGGTEVYFDIAVVVIMAVTVGNYYENRVTARATDRLTALTEERVDTARCRTQSGATESVPIETLDGGDEVLVKPGERIPIDGTVIEGTATVDESLITGEARPADRTTGDGVVGGSLVTDGALVIEVEPGATSTIDRLVDLLWEIKSSSPGAQRLADRLAAVFVPLVLMVAVAAMGWHLATGAGATAAILTGLAVLVVSCPCALGLATPLAVASSINAALAAGIVISDGSVFERATGADIIAFDKTGTLTTGRMRVHSTTNDEVLRRAAAVEQFSDHPVAGAIVQAAERIDSAAEFERHPGRGVSADVGGDRVSVGSRAFVDQRGWSIPTTLEEQAEVAERSGAIPTFVAWGSSVQGVIVVGDEPRHEWETVVHELAAERTIVVLTGDAESAVTRYRTHPDIDEVFAGVPPEGKTAVIERLRTRGTVAMVGDGSNDAPALAAADVGIALERGTALAADAADAVITTDDLTAVPRVFSLTRAARTRIRQNIGWAFLYNVIAIPLAAIGAINPLFAALAMASSSLVVVGNSARPLERIRNRDD